MTDSTDQTPSRRKAITRLGTIALALYAAPALTTLSVARASGSSSSSGSSSPSPTSSPTSSSATTTPTSSSTTTTPSTCSGPEDDDAGCSDGQT